MSSFFTQITRDNPKVRVQSRRRSKNSIYYEIRATKTSAYQAVKLGPLSWEINNSFAEKMLSLFKIHHVFSFLYLLYDCLYVMAVTRNKKLLTCSKNLHNTANYIGCGMLGVHCKYLFIKIIPTNRFYKNN